MDVKTENVVKVTMVLDEKEAQWLHNYMQNPACEPDRESVDDRNMRMRFFNATFYKTFA